MALHAALTHRTHYTYDRPAAMGPQIVRLRPAPHSRTPILSYSLGIEPKQHFINWQQDPFGNYLARIVVPEKTRAFEVTVDLVADMATVNPFDFFVEDSASAWPFAYGATMKDELSPYLIAPEPGPRLNDYLSRLKIDAVTSLDFIWGLNLAVQRDVGYLIRMEPGVQTPEETLGRGCGSCRDSGWLLVQIMRHYGLAARFVSGYLIQLKPDVKALDGPSGTDRDFTDLHAWAEVYLPGAGWIGLDPTSGLFAGEGHIPLAATPSPQSAAPISGSIDDGVGVTFSFDMTVKRLLESPRVTLPYSPGQWQDIDRAGRAVDGRLAASGVGLTMGGEPTFVSASDPGGAEWNTAAAGPTKRDYAENLIRRLRHRFAPGGLLHFGQGKWYPGEQLPRWAFALYWRDDGEPLWHNESLIESETPSKPVTPETLEAFTASLCDRLGFAEDSAIPAYEDPAHFLLIEQRLPLTPDPRATALDDPAERARLLKVFERGLDKPAGFVLPIQVWHSAHGARRWKTDRWELRRKRLFLLPGDSPAGFRLPIGSLAYGTADRYPEVIALDPFAARPPLPTREVLLQARTAATPEKPAPVRHGDIDGTVRTAMTIEPRDGKLCVFMPPLGDAEDYAALAAAIEETASAIGQPVHIEGYEPPYDPRVNVIKVTPDPGVIEVNIHPASSWTEAVTMTEALYEEAHLSGLTAEKFMVDGRHIGTGGGNHIVLGAKTPAESPFLRRPDLLSSIIAYWQNHPSLSYLFSGMFIGPTSQAPRIDEARNDQLYEMEIAFSQVPDASSGAVPPWLVDRIFRNLLIDSSGNTHRAEICIDKLYSPDTSSGRLGLVEFRGFEMPPHPHMSLAQQMLLRALVAWFWEQPYKRKLIPWGTELHDRFMLPYSVWHDFKDVIRDLKSAGFPVQAAWFAPHFEFRFPVYGTVSYEGVGIELRAALEPWHVLGEEGSPGGTVRYVDSSLERLQVTVTGNSGNRYRAGCNGVALPLLATETRGTSFCGVRYRAWQPPNCLHPTIAPHTPLVFDVYDTWNGRSIGGCRYHVAHPGGRAHETFPVNALEAETRRAARFEATGHTPGTTALREAAANPSFPHTLDLRLC